jgi:mannonate dehydratase
MDRRKFVRVAGSGIAIGGLAETAEAIVAAQVAARPPRQSSDTKAKPRKALMKVGTQHGDSNEILRVLAGFGVNYICSRLPSERLDEHWSVEGLSRLRERIESFGLILDVVPLPMSSNYITKAELPNILLGKSPERDREIDDVCQMIRNAARARIPTLKYNLTFLGVPRTESTKGRGGAEYSTFVYDKARQDPP